MSARERFTATPQNYSLLQNYVQYTLFRRAANISIKQLIVVGCKRRRSLTNITIRRKYALLL